MTTYMGDTQDHSDCVHRPPDGTDSQPMAFSSSMQLLDPILWDAADVVGVVDVAYMVGAVAMTRWAKWTW